MARLPQPGADQGQWGDILNDYLSQAHTSAGVIKDGSITEAQLDVAVQTKLNSGGGGSVASVNGQTGVVTLTKADIGLVNIDNTSDSNKPVSTATQTALDSKAALVHAHTASQVSDSTVTGRSVLTAADAATARTAIGAGTSNLTIGTSSGTAKAGDYTPTKSDVGLGNVDNTSDATKNSATATLTNKTLTSPVIAKISNLSSNGLVTTSGGDGTLGISTLPSDGNKYLDGFGNFTAPQAILVEKGAFTPSTTYTRGDIVTYQYAR